MAKLHIEMSEKDNGSLEMKGSVVEMFSLMTFVLWQIAKDSGVSFDIVRDDFIELLSTCDTSLLEQVEEDNED